MLRKWDSGKAWCAARNWRCDLVWVREEGATIMPFSSVQTISETTGQMNLLSRQM
jgi:hypothetical protein